ncbi:MAG: FecR domain-containing protein [Comamonadaceae bacterium]|nr:FecR domain-containing protein [Comamonadaceae bacterium]
MTQTPGQPWQRYNGVQQDRQMPSGYKIRIPLAWLRTLPAEANVIDFQGQVEIVAVGDGTVRPAQRGMRLKSGDQVRTLPGGNLALQLQDGSKVLVHEGTDMVLDTTQTYKGTGMLATRLRLSAGRIETEVARQTPSRGRCEVITPTAHLGVRGTRIPRHGRCRPRKSHAAKFWTGWVAVAGGKSSNAAVIVPAGYGTVVDARRRPARPVELLALPDLSHGRDAAGTGTHALQVQTRCERRLLPRPDRTG